MEQPSQKSMKLGRRRLHVGASMLLLVTNKGQGASRGCGESLGGSLVQVLWDRRGCKAMRGRSQRARLQRVRTEVSLCLRRAPPPSICEGGHIWPPTQMVCTLSARGQKLGRLADPHTTVGHGAVDTWGGGGAPVVVVVAAVVVASRRLANRPAWLAVCRRLR